LSQVIIKNPTFEEKSVTLNSLNIIYILEFKLKKNRLQFFKVSFFLSCHRINLFKI